MPNFPTSGLIGVTNTTQGADTDQKFALGTRTEASNDQVWVYVQAGFAINASDAVAIDNAFQAYQMTKTRADLGYQPGNAPYAIPAASYGWVIIHGAGITQTVLASCDKGMVLCTSAVSGILDDGTVSQTKIVGSVSITSAGTAGTTTLTANFVNPHVILS